MTRKLKSSSDWAYATDVLFPQKACKHVQKLKLVEQSNPEVVQEDLSQQLISAQKCDNKTIQDN